MSVGIARPITHNQTTFTQAAIARSPSPWFAPPVPAYMREPGTNYFTIISAPDQSSTIVARRTTTTAQPAARPPGY